MESKTINNTQFVLGIDSFLKLFETLSQMGYQVIAPVVSDNAIVYDEVTNVAELPAGYIDDQEGGKYRLEKTGRTSLFEYVVGPQSWKKYLYPSKQVLWEAKRTKNGFKINHQETELPRRAFLGVRACELAAIEIHDKVFAQGEYKDPLYEKNRENSLIVAINCVRAGKTCFCGSMGTGPKVKSGYDLVLTELNDKGNHRFIIEAGSKKGEEILSDLPVEKASDDDIAGAEKAIGKAAESMGRTLDTNNLKEIISRNFDHPHWEIVATRCLTCGNCTMVCPTCFCSTIEDTTDLTGETAVRVKRWDSCFTLDFSYIYGGSIRESGMSRYRQWISHKLSAWVDQFGTYGCVGCGRCITWCPVGIDITEEARIIRESDLKGDASLYNKDIKDGNA